MADAKTEKQKVKEITDRLEEGLKELRHAPDRHEEARSNLGCRLPGIYKPCPLNIICRIANDSSYSKECMEDLRKGKDLYWLCPVRGFWRMYSRERYNILKSFTNMDICVKIQS